MLHLQSVTKYFSSHLLAQKQAALKSVSFSVRPKELTGFLGANGAGKTTSIKIMLDLIRPDEGAISWEDGENFFNITGYLPEHPYFYQSVSGRDFVSYLAKLSGVLPKQTQDRMEYWGKRLKISHALDKKIRFYSKGMLQRLGVLSVLIHDPRLIILDEPLNGLDPSGRKDLKEILKELNGLGKTILFSSHILSDVEEICSQVIVLKEGEVFYDGPLEGLLNRSQGEKFKIVYSSYQGERKSIEVGQENKEQVLGDLISGGNKILTVSTSSPSLEEIIYETN